MIILITGGAGFIGHHVVQHLLVNTEHEMVLLDRLDTSGNLNRLAEIPDWDKHKKRCRVVFHDLRAELNSQLRGQIGKVDAIIHMAASTHVDRSIENPLEFVHSNVLGTAHLLDFARGADIEQMIYFGTDEVFGPAPKGVLYKEWDRYKSGNPYSATKAGGEELCLAYHNTYGVPVRIMHTMNVFGQRQHPEKYVPMVIAKIRDGELVTVHADATLTQPGSRFYIHARNVADAVMFVMKNGENGEKYNVVGEREMDNLELAKMISQIQGKELVYKLVDFHSSRKGHDPRYALDGSKMEALGWKPKVSFEKSLEHVVKWTLDNPHWLVG